MYNIAHDMIVNIGSVIKLLSGYYWITMLIIIVKIDKTFVEGNL